MIRIRLSLALLVVVATTPAAGEWPLAITVDDVPLHTSDTCTKKGAAGITEALLSAFDDQAIVATALVVTEACGEPDGTSLAIATRWRERGHDIGNHGARHLDFNATDVNDYLADIQRADQQLSPLWRDSQQAQRWFRAPMLHMGDTTEKQKALQDWLHQHQYKNAPVTIDNQEWLFAAAYEKASAANNPGLKAKIADAYIAHILDAAHYSRQLTSQLLGRDMAQVLLLHANQLNAEHLPRLLRWLRASGARWVTLSDALTDPAYQQPDHYVGKQGLSWLLRWALAKNLAVTPEPRQPPWIAEASKGRFPAPEPAAQHALWRELDAANRQFSQQWLSSNSAEMARAYASEAVLLPPAGGVIVGRAAIQSFWSSVTIPDRLSHFIEPAFRQQLSDTLVTEVGRWITVTGKPDSAQWKSGCYTVLWRFQEGRWVMQSDQWLVPNEGLWACRRR